MIVRGRNGALCGRLTRHTRLSHPAEKVRSQSLSLHHPVRPSGDFLWAEHKGPVSAAFCRQRTVSVGALGASSGRECASVSRARMRVSWPREAAHRETRFTFPRETRFVSANFACSAHFPRRSQFAVRARPRLEKAEECGGRRGSAGGTTCFRRRHGGRKRWADPADLNRCCFRPRRLTSWCEFSGGLFLGTPCSWRPESPNSRRALPQDPSLSVTNTCGA